MLNVFESISKMILTNCLHHKFLKNTYSEGKLCTQIIFKIYFATVSKAKFIKKKQIKCMKFVIVM